MDPVDMADPDSLKSFYLQVIGKYGTDSQSDATLEEAAELIQAICKYRHAARRGENLDSVQDRVIEELADLEIALDQAKLIYCGSSTDDEKRFAEVKKRKLAKLAWQAGIPIR